MSALQQMCSGRVLDLPLKYVMSYPQPTSERGRIPEYQQFFFAFSIDASPVIIQNSDNVFGPNNSLRISDSGVGLAWLIGLLFIIGIGILLNSGQD
jgi:hypothetical protein